MATRSTIKIEGIKYAKVYKHYDGSPKSTLPWLIKFNKEFSENRGTDPEYKFAQLLRSSVMMSEEFKLDTSDFTGWGVVGFNAHMDAEYEYVLHVDGSVTWTEV